jgi:hypothetical protein
VRHKGAQQIADGKYTNNLKIHVNGWTSSPRQKKKLTQTMLKKTPDSTTIVNTLSVTRVDPLSTRRIEVTSLRYVLENRHSQLILNLGGNWTHHALYAINAVAATFENAVVDVASMRNNDG